MVFDVKEIAKLAKIKVTDQEVRTLEKNIQDIINMLEKLDKVEIDKSRSLENVLLDDLPQMGYRDDIKDKSMTNEELIMNAPMSLAGCIIVPKTVD